MRSRKSFLGLGILVLMLVLGVGYAVVNNVTLTISGTATAKEAELNVYFDASVNPVLTNATNGKVAAEITDKKNATIEVTELALSETVTAVYTIKNGESDVAASLATPVITVESAAGTDLSEYFNVTATLAENSLDAGASTTVTVVVTLAKTPTIAAYSTADINIQIVASPAA